MNDDDPRRPGAVLAALPNLISCVRIGLVPVFVALAFDAQAATRAGADPAAARLPALATLLTIGASDLLDGWLARRFDLATNVGAFLDAAADKLAQVVLLVFFALVHGPAFTPVPVWFVALVLARDVVLATGGLALRVRHGAVAVVHRLHGKLASVVVFALLVAVTAGIPPRSLAGGLVVASALVVFSTAAYVRDGVLQDRATRAGRSGR